MGIVVAKGDTKGHIPAPIFSSLGGDSSAPMLLEGPLAIKRTRDVTPTRAESRKVNGDECRATDKVCQARAAE